jgi:DNA helicase-2/ATP-dependent DNA helicase PcrA
MNFGSNYSTPGWQRAQARRGSGGFSETGAPRGERGGFGERRQLAYEADEDAGTYDSGDRRDYGEDSSPPPLRGRSGAEGSRVGGIPKRRTPLTIEGELVAKSTGTVSAFSVGDRVFHQKFGNGNVVAVDGNKLTIHFDKAGEKRVVDSFIERV